MCNLVDPVLLSLIIMDYYFISGTPGPMALDDFEKIVGGVEATPHQFPWQVGLFFDGYFCGGSIICKFVF